MNMLTHSVPSARFQETRGQGGGPNTQAEPPSHLISAVEAAKSLRLEEQQSQERNRTAEAEMPLSSVCTALNLISQGSESSRPAAFLKRLADETLAAGKGDKPREAVIAEKIKLRDSLLKKHANWSEEDLNCFLNVSAYVTLCIVSSVPTTAVAAFSVVSKLLGCRKPADQSKPIGSLKSEARDFLNYLKGEPARVAESATLGTKVASGLKFVARVIGIPAYLAERVGSLYGFAVRKVKEHNIKKTDEQLAALVSAEIADNPQKYSELPNTKKAVVAAARMCSRVADAAHALLSEQHPDAPLSKADILGNTVAMLKEVLTRNRYYQFSKYAEELYSEGGALQGKDSDALATELLVSAEYNEELTWEKEIAAKIRDFYDTQFNNSKQELSANLIANTQVFPDLISTLTYRGCGEQLADKLDSVGSDRAKMCDILIAANDREFSYAARTIGLPGMLRRIVPHLKHIFENAPQLLGAPSSEMSDRAKALCQSVEYRLADEVLRGALAAEHSILSVHTKITTSPQAAPIDLQHSARQEIENISSHALKGCCEQILLILKDWQSDTWRRNSSYRGSIKSYLAETIDTKLEAQERALLERIPGATQQDLINGGVIQSEANRILISMQEKIEQLVAKPGLTLSDILAAI